jgi:tetratricopeptide (TPR) repeat protein
MRTLVCGSLLVPMLALAQPKTPDDWYKEGETQYNLGNFDKAAEAFKQGFAAETVDSKKAAYLYNVAQAYRQGGKCKDAAFFYKRYLSLKDEDAGKPLSAEKRSEIEQRIAEQEECAKKLDENAQKPPSNTLPPETGSGSAAGSNKVVAQVDTTPEGSDDGEEPETPTVIPPPKVLTARFTGGASKISAGSTLNIPVKPVFTLVAGYPVYVQDKIEIDAGAAAAFSPLPYELLGTNEQKTGSLTTLLADAGATYLVTPRIGLRADAGIGILILGGVSAMNNPFTDMGAPTSGALSMLAVRGAVSADYAITPNIYATLVPFAFTYSPPKDGLRSDIKSITRMDFMVGVGYRM